MEEVVGSIPTRSTILPNNLHVASRHRSGVCCRGLATDGSAYEVDVELRLTDEQLHAGAIGATLLRKSGLRTVISGRCSTQGAAVWGSESLARYGRAPQHLLLWPALDTHKFIKPAMRWEEVTKNLPQLLLNSIGGE